MHVVWVGRLSCATDVSCRTSRTVCHPIVIASRVCSMLRAYCMCANIHVSGNLTCIIRCTIRQNPKWTDVAYYMTWYQFMWQAMAKETQNNLVQLQPTPSVDSNMHHIGVDDVSIATSYTQDTDSVSWLDTFLATLRTRTVSHGSTHSSLHSGHGQCLMARHIPRYTQDTDSVSWLDTFLVHLEFVHPPLLRITLCMFIYLHRASWHSSDTLTEVFSVLFPQL
jgi:hypothetical protein